MAESTPSDVWYMYENDIHGVNALLAFESKAALIAYLRDDPEFLEGRFDAIDDALRAAVHAIADQYARGDLDDAELSEALTVLYGEHGSEVECVEIEAFSSICTGQSDFAQEAIETFCDVEEIELVAQIDAALQPAFRRFFENADEIWIG